MLPPISDDPFALPGLLNSNSQRKELKGQQIELDIQKKVDYYLDNDSQMYGGAFPDYNTHKIKKSPRPYLRRIKPSEFIEALERRKRQ